jgi:cell division cycle 20-like protein 1, cofactor of APC complex
MGAMEDLPTSKISNSPISKVNNVNPFNTPPVNTPPRARTPPPGADSKRRMERSGNVDSGNRSDRSKTMDAAVDPNALSKALMREFEETGRTRDVTPGGSPSRKRQRIYGDR